MNVVDALLGHDVAADAPALLTLEGDATYGELSAAIDDVASFLHRAGIQKGECVVLLAENSLFYVAAYLGALKAGAVAVPLSTTVSKEHCEEIVRTTKARLGFAQAKLVPDYASGLSLLEEVVVDGPLRAALSGPQPHAYSELQGRAEGQLPSVEVNEREDLALMLFTSGSTSRPRGVMLTHRNVLANTASIRGYLPLTRTDRAMVVLPFQYSFGASVLHTHLQAGASLVIDRRFMFPEKILQRMLETKCTGFAGVPSHFQILLRRSRLKTLTFPDLRWVQQAGGKLPDLFIQELRDALPQTKVFIMYGATEATARIAYLPPERLGDKLGSIGRAIPGVTIHLLDENGQPVKPGEVGEIVVEGENVARGYFGDADESAATFRNGRLHTGDLARMDDDGFLFIVDRAKDFLKCGGNRVSSKVVEEALLAFPDIVEAAVVAMPDEVLGEAVAAFVVAKDPKDETVAQRLAAFAAEKLGPQLAPKRVTVLPSLPKNDAGKVRKVLLKQMV